MLLNLTPKLWVFPIVAALEEMKLNTKGSHYFLGCVFRFGRTEPLNQFKARHLSQQLQGRLDWENIRSRIK